MPFQIQILTIELAFCICLCHYITLVKSISIHGAMCDAYKYFVSERGRDNCEFHWILSLLCDQSGFNICVPFIYFSGNYLERGFLRGILK